MYSTETEGEPPPTGSSCKCQCAKELKELNEKLVLAGHFGRQILQTNSDLQQQLDDATARNAAEIEALEQSRFSLERRLEQREHMEGLHADEAEGLRHQMAQRKQDELRALEDHSVQVQQLKRQVSSMQSELDKRHLSLAQSSQHTGDLEARLKDALQQLDDQRKEKLSDQSSDDLALIEDKLYAALSEKAHMEEQLAEKTSSHKQLELELQAVKSRLVEREKDLEDVQRDSTSYYNTLQRTREEMSELKVELDLVRMDAQRHEKKGNSLFSEVEDRRMEAEKELISLKVQHAALAKQQELTRDHLHKLKVQMAGLLQMCGGRAATRHAERLEQQLAQARSQIQALASAVPSASRDQPQADDSEMNAYKESCTGDPGDYKVQFYRAQLKEKDNELVKAQAECRTQRLLNLSESKKLVDMESRLYNSEQLCEGLTSQLERAKLSLDEMRLKYEPEKVKSKPREREFYVEKIPLDGEDEEVPCSAEAPEGAENILKVREEPPQKPAESEGGDSAFWDGVRNNLKQKRPLEPSGQKPEERALKSLKVKKVTMSDSVDVYSEPPRSHTEQEEDNKEGSSPSETQGAGTRVKGGKRYHNVVKVSSAQATDQDKCKMQ